MIRKLSAVLVVSVSACAAFGAHVPSNLQGDIPLTVANNSGSPLCSLRIYPNGSPVPAESWFGVGRLETGKAQPYKVKAGVYALEAEDCNHEFTGTVRTLRLEGPTFVTIGTNPGPRPAAKEVFVPALLTAQSSGAENPGPAEAAPAGGDDAAKSNCLPLGAKDPTYQVPCCSHKTILRGGHQVCCESGDSCG